MVCLCMLLLWWCRKTVNVVKTTHFCAFVTCVDSLLVSIPTLTMHMQVPSTWANAVCSAPRSCAPAGTGTAVAVDLSIHCCTVGGHDGDVRSSPTVRDTPTRLSNYSVSKMCPKAQRTSGSIYLVEQDASACVCCARVGQKVWVKTMQNGHFMVDSFRRLQVS